MHQLVNNYGPRFEKEILRVGSFRDPLSGKVYELDERDLEELADSTNRWIELGYKVWFPWSSDADSKDARKNIGFWSDFSVQEDRLVAVAVIFDERALVNLGKTFDDVSPRISENVRAATGEWFGRVIESIAGAVTPPVTGLAGFVRLDRRTTPGRRPTLLEAAIELGLVKRPRRARHGVELSREGNASEGGDTMSGEWAARAMAKASAIAAWARRATTKEDPGRGPFVFEIPERPTFVMPDVVYADVKVKAERWHELGREIERRTAEEKTKSEALTRLAEREAQEGVLLDKQMTKLQEEIETARKARELGELRRPPALEAAWRAAAAADERAYKEIDAYKPKADAYEKTVEDVIEQLAAALEGLQKAFDLSSRNFDNARRTYNLPQHTHEFNQKVQQERAAESNTSRPEAVTTA